MPDNRPAILSPNELATLTQRHGNGEPVADLAAPLGLSAHDLKYAMLAYVVSAGKIAVPLAKNEG